MDISSIKKLIDSHDKDFHHSLKQALLQFKCKRDLDVQGFLHSYAISYDKNHRARTYLCFEDSVFAAYFSLTIKNLEIQGTISKSCKKRLTYGLIEQKTVPAYLIAQIGKDDRCTSENIAGKVMEKIMQIIRNANQEVGGRIIYLECKDVEKLQHLYEALGFTYMQKNKELCQMIKFLD